MVTIVPESTTDRERIIAHMKTHSLVRARDLRTIGISASAISRAAEEGVITRLSRGLYESAESDVSIHIQFAEIAKRYPRFNICLLSALGYYRVTDQIPRKIWGAIAAKGWQPKSDYPEIRVVRFREPYYSGELTHHNIANVDVPIYSLEKTLADAFRNPKLVDRSVAIESLKATLAERKSTPAKLAEVARAYGAWNQMSPYLEALTANG